MKNIIKVGIISLVVVISLTGCGCTKEKKKEFTTSYVIEEDAIINESNDITKDQKIDGLTFTNTSLIYQNNMSTFEVTITNTTNSDYSLKNFYISLKDKNGDELAKLGAYAEDVIKSGQSVVVTSLTDANLSEAVSIEYLDITKK